MSTNIFITTKLRLAKRIFKTVVYILLFLLGRVFFFFLPLSIGKMFRKLKEKKKKSAERTIEI